jgi:hypothetical protein
VLANSTLAALGLPILRVKLTNRACLAFGKSWYICESPWRAWNARLLAVLRLILADWALRAHSLAWQLIEVAALALHATDFAGF